MQELYAEVFFMKSLKRKRAARTDLRVLSALCLAAVILYGAARIPVLAEYLFARGVTRWLSFVLGSLLGPLPVSFYEVIAVCLIAGGCVLAAYLIVLLFKKRFGAAVSILYRLAVAALSVLLAFGLLYAPLYSRASVDGALGLEKSAVTEESLYDAAEYYVSALNAASEKLSRDGEGNVLPTRTFGELAAEINDGFDSFDGGYFARYDVRPKAVLLSVPMSYLGITGIYFPFTAEANINVNIPSYELPCTMAHEMAHAKGISRENDANVAAYAVCILSEDVYLNYSGLMNAVAVLLNALPEEDFEELRAKLDGNILREYRNAAEHYEKYEGFIDSLSSFFNDLFLKANGVPSGTGSYGETTKSLVALYEKINGGK